MSKGSSSPLLRASSFCFERNGIPEVEVTISILSSIPITPSSKKKRRTKTNSFAPNTTSRSIINHYSHNSIVYVTEKLLISLSLKNGDVAWLSSHHLCSSPDKTTNIHTTNCNVACEYGIPVIVCIQPQKLKKKRFCDSIKDNVEESLSDDHIIYVPPTLASSIGCYNNGTRCWVFVPYRQIIKEAKNVTVRSIGRPFPSTNLYGRSLGLRHSSLTIQERNKMDPTNLLERYFSNNNLPKQSGRKVNKHEQRCLLFSRFSLISIFYEAELYFFEITDVEEQSSSISKPVWDHDDTNSPIVFITTPGTKWKPSPSANFQNINNEGLPSRLALVPRLPSLSLTECFHRTFDNTPSSTTRIKKRSIMGDQMNKTESLLGCQFKHPSLNDMLFALSIPKNFSSPEQKVMHVVGTDYDNHVGQCIESSASILGMRYISVHGLAAYAHRHHCLEDAESGNNTTVTTGSIIDKMNGLYIAIKQAEECSPCILHLNDFHQELAAKDEPLRHNEEERFWISFMDALTTTTTSVNATISIDGRDTMNLRRKNHPLLIVISTEKPLRPGPLLQHLVHRSVKIRLPDEQYARQLWGFTNVSGKRCNCNFDDIRHYLLGRPAEDILRLKHMLSLKLKEAAATGNVDCNDGNKTDQKALLSDLCRQLDEQRSSGSSISTNIPNIRWEDVGGLSHVRREIMDSIEIPLRYPHLFPNNKKGRSGILLYGPPGTGKTLVAKAVATECGLPFISVKGPELLGSYVGESEANVRATFATAREAAVTNRVRSASCSEKIEAGNSNGRNNGGATILFFDELDSLAPRRGGVGDGGGVMERVVATLLTELDGRCVDNGANKEGSNYVCQQQPIVFVIGATNRPDLLDPSLLRPGRLDRLVYLGQASTKKDRSQILAALIRKYKLEQDSNPMDMALQVVDELPQFLSGADFAAIASGALMRGLHRLCNEVEGEAERLNHERSKCRTEVSKEQMTIDIDYVMRQMTEGQIEPVVTKEDLIEAGKNVSPSVSADEIAKFERLKKEYSSQG